MDKDKIKKQAQEDLDLARRFSGLLGTPEWNIILDIVEKRFLSAMAKWNSHSCPKCTVGTLREGIEKELSSKIRRGERASDTLKTLTE